MYVLICDANASRNIERRRGKNVRKKKKKKGKEGRQIRRTSLTSFSAVMSGRCSLGSAGPDTWREKRESKKRRRGKEGRLSRVTTFTMSVIFLFCN